MSRQRSWLDIVINITSWVKDGWTITFLRLFGGFVGFEIGDDINKYETKLANLPTVLERQGM